MNAFIFAIFTCTNSSGGFCLDNHYPRFRYAENCMSFIQHNMVPKGSKLIDGRFYLNDNLWFQCYQKPTWSAVN